ncbi:MAG: type II secretion system F family protein [Minisyncoccus archaeiphilus]|jgi:type IV pilus assembly protein PilC|uniref:type II secretion system F family protein n=1 Tax=Minisyncoccus archaeiphilus TaxID=3238481 RepID=UPI0009D547F6|nr:MAG: Type II secretion system protein F [Parcubacteria group bacterium ADurb.Bin216]GMX59575.1 MAG: type II secretion system F family protein [Candidatus Parcubacteria bacterium]
MEEQGNFSQLQKIESNHELFSIGLGEERKYFLENLAMLVDAGVPINESFRVISEGSKSKRMKDAICRMAEQIEGGFPLWKAMRASKLFTKQTISLVRIGEETANLVENLQIVVEQQKKEESFKSKVRSAIIYPLIILFVALVVAGGVCFFLLPRLTKVFKEMKIELPAITKALIAISTFFENYGLIVIPLGIILFLVLTYFLFIYKKTKHIGQFMSFHFFGVKRIIRETELARFGYNLGMLLRSGLSISECLDSLVKSTDFYGYRNLYKKMKVDIEEGRSFSEIFNEEKKVNDLIPRPIQQMIIVAERSGRLPETMIKINEIYEEKIDDTTKNLAVILEPILLIVIWTGVLLLALAIIMPIYGIIGDFNRGF